MDEVLVFALVCPVYPVLLWIVFELGQVKRACINGVPK